MKKQINILYLIINILGSIGSCVESLLGAFLFKYVMNVIVGIDKLSNYFIIIEYLVLFILFETFMVFYRNYLKKLLSEDLNLKIKKIIFTKYINLPFVKFYDTDTGSKSSVIINDVDTYVNNYVMGFFTLFTSVLLIGSALISIFVTNYILGIYIVASIIISMLLPTAFQKKLMAAQEKISKEKEETTNSTIDYIKGYDVIVSYGIKDRVIRDFYKSFNILRKHNLSYFGLNTVIQILSNLCGTLSFLGIIVFGGYFVYKGNMTIGSLIFCIQMCNYVGNPIGTAVEAVSGIKGAKYNKEKLEKIISENSSKSEANKGKCNFNNSIHLDNVSFRYNDDTALIDNFSFEFEKGKKYAIVGFSGCGKSTLIKLIAGKLKCNKGKILIDNKDLEYIDDDSKIKIISEIQQETFIFNATLKENITLFSDEYSDEEIQNVLRITGLMDICDRLENGINTEVRENGSIFSGGEKQRIAISRAILKNSEILLCDEITSNLDNKIAYDIEKHLINLENKTVINVTHKFNSNIYNYDCILTMKDGKLIEYGKAEDLSKNGELFSALLSLNSVDVGN